MNRNTKRIPIRKRVLFATLTITLAMLAVAVITSVFFMNRMMHKGEKILAEELNNSLSHAVVQKASNTDTRLETYKKYMVLIRDYVEKMYESRDEMIATGQFVDSSRATTPEGEYAMQSAFASEDYDVDAYMDEIYFFSHLQSILEPIAKENEEQITTLYLGTKSGLMISYDKWAYLSAVPEPDFFVYDFKQSDWYKEGINRDDVFFTSLYVDSMGRGLTITVATPFKDDKGEVQGVLSADFDITGIYNELISMDHGEGSSYFAVDSKGAIISIDSEEEVLINDYLQMSDADISKIISGEVGVIESDKAFYAYAPIEQVDWTLCAVVPHTTLFEKVQSLEYSFRAAMISFLLISVALVGVGIFLSNKVTESITHPIELLVKDMQIIADGDLDHKATAYRNDEIGDMTYRLNDMVDRLKDTIHNLVKAQDRAEKMRELATKDPLTSVRNKGAFDTYLEELQSKINQGEKIEFAVGVFDCDNLKPVNDLYGHDKGDLYLKAASTLICSIFRHSPVFRIGGDEFSVVLKDKDYQNRDDLIRQFETSMEEVSASAKNRWEEVHVSMGIAAYDPETDLTVSDTSRRADKIMYKNKHYRKTKNGHR